MLSLMRRLWAWRERRALRQFIKFCIVGGINTVVDFGAYFLLTRQTAFFSHDGGHYLLAATLTFSLAVVSSFCLNTFWTFRAGGPGWHRRAPQFVAVTLVGLFINDLVMYLVVTAGGHDMVGKVAAAGLVTFWNFFAQKHWTFRA
jgi:putative flippase GtrA